MASRAYGGPKDSIGKLHFTCGACGHRDLVIILKSAPIERERARTLAACPRCGARDRDATFAYWLAAGAKVALPFVALLLVAVIAFSNSWALMLACAGSGAAISLFLLKRVAMVRWRRINRAITFASRQQAEMEYATGHSGKGRHNS